jgi:cellulose biosynthesis protein BcsQ
MRSIAFFNNKGGVGKTTLLCNLAAYFSIERDRNVLVIDADPQCNATQSMFDDATINTIYDDRSSFTIYSVVRPLSLGKGYTESFQPMRAENFGIDILVGDPRLALTEDLLARDWGTATAGDTRGVRTTFLFAQLLSLCAQYDYVFFDMGPSLGSINRSVLIATDHFISPMSIDIFSIRAIENITTSLTQWQKQLRSGIASNDEPDELPGGEDAWHLRFAGYITQQYLAKTKEGERRAVDAYERIMKRIPRVVRQEYIAKVQSGFPHVEYDLGTVQNLHGLVPMSQSSRKPIFMLKARDGVRGAHFTKVRDSVTIFARIAENLERNLGQLHD